ncbi:MAG: tyrosine-type recombinase/integrase [Bacillota bacterium]
MRKTQVLRRIKQKKGGLKNVADAPSYQAKLHKEKTLLLRGLLNELPAFCRDFFRGIESGTSILTRINYAYDMRLFFNFLRECVPMFASKEIASITLDDLERIERRHLEMFLEYLNYYEANNKEHENHERGKARKLSTLRSFFKYYFKAEALSRNVAALVDMPKTHEKPIIRLEADEVVKLIQAVDLGIDLTPAQMKYHRFTKQRDLALLILLLGTGIRISELVGIDLADVDFGVNGIKITRKGGNQVIIYFGDEVERFLRAYMAEREAIEPKPGHENALFLSLQKRRISVRAMQDLVKKYARIATPLKRISPHKLRSTYGTMLYEETGDIYLVADVLGHKDVNTTRKHYASVSDDRRRMAARVVKLRDD